MKYSVLTEPVIPVIYPDGRTDELGIRSVFEQAHEIRDICGATPMERYALMRLLLAFAMDMLHPEDSFERQDLLEAGQFDMRTFDEYISLCEADGPRFDLFDEKHPFMQARYDAVQDTEPKGVANLFQELPTGNNHMFFDHRYEDDHAVSPARAFRAMCALYVFATPVGAQKYPSGVNNTSPLYAMIVGDTLFKNIVLNMLSEAECGNMVYGQGLVPWRLDCVIVPKKEYAEVTVLEALTWQPRRITFVAEMNGFIKSVYLKQGKDFKGNKLWVDPYVPYRRKKDGDYVSIKPEMGRALWRDAGALTLDVDARYGRQPTVIRCLENVLNIDEKWVCVRTMGLVTNNGSLLEWVESELSIPACLLKQAEAADLFRMDINGIEQMYRVLYRAVANHLTETAAVQAGSVFLGLGHELLFGELLEKINGMSCEGITESVIEEYLSEYEKLIRQLIRQVIETVVRRTGDSAREMRKQILAEKEIWMRCSKYMKERRESHNG